MSRTRYRFGRSSVRSVGCRWCAIGQRPVTQPLTPCCIHRHTIRQFSSNIIDVFIISLALFFMFSPNSERLRYTFGKHAPLRLWITIQPSRHLKSTVQGNQLRCKHDGLSWSKIKVIIVWARQSKKKKNGKFVFFFFLKKKSTIQERSFSKSVIITALQKRLNEKKITIIENTLYIRKLSTNSIHLHMLPQNFDLRLPQLYFNYTRKFSKGISRNGFMLSSFLLRIIRKRFIY